MRNALLATSSSSTKGNTNQSQLLYVGIVATVVAAGMLWYTMKLSGLGNSNNRRLKNKDDENDDDELLSSGGFESVHYSSSSSSSKEIPPNSSSSAAAGGGSVKSTNTTNTTSTPLISNVLLSSSNEKAKCIPALQDVTNNDTTTTTTTATTTKEEEEKVVSSSSSSADDVIQKNQQQQQQQEQQEIHKKVEDADKKGKTLFKAKKFIEAADCFTEAIDLIEKFNDNNDSTTMKLKRQAITLKNNRSAMYEKAGYTELALCDCDSILEEDVSHEKARLRKLRVLESEKKYREALVEVCALQLLFMRDNRDKLRMGIPIKPPVPQEKIEELMSQILPEEVENTVRRVKDIPRNLPSTYTVTQLLKSFSGYNSWMSKAAKEENVLILTAKLEEIDKKMKTKKMEENGKGGEQGEEKEKGEGEEKTNDNNEDSKNAESADSPLASSPSSPAAAAAAAVQEAKKAELLLRRGIKSVYDGKFELASQDFELSLKLLDDNEDVMELFDETLYPRLLEWVGICRHLRYNLDGALKCYEKCSDLEPTNAEILVKRAGVQMDAGKIDQSLELFDMALGLEPDLVDALLHRSNLKMLQQLGLEAKNDLKLCLKLRPNFILANLRLATVLMSEGDLDGASKCLDDAEALNPNSSEVHSYRGEMYFAKGEYEKAKEEFNIAMKCEPNNPTPFVNAALAVMNTVQHPSEASPNITKAVELLQKAISVDPMFHAAYVHLGQLKLSMATNLVDAKEVITLYDDGIEQCRTPDELRDICSMRVLTVAQVEAATALKMETLNLQ